VTAVLYEVENLHRQIFTDGRARMYTRPFTIKVPHDLLADADIFEMYCNENEKDGVHLKKGQ
jgi:hypothetical protein